jgi:hypothetical protein
MHFQTWHWLEVSGQFIAAAALSPGKSPSTHWKGSWVGPRAGLDAVAKKKKKKPISAVAGNRTPALQSLAWSLLLLTS